MLSDMRVVDVNANDLKNPGAELVRKLISVLELVERFPLFLYDATPGCGSGFGLQVGFEFLLFVLVRKIPSHNGSIIFFETSYLFFPVPNFFELVKRNMI